MATTAVFAELIVIGLQAEAWLTLLVLGLVGTDWVSLSGLEKWAALITIVVVAGAYMLGVLLDRIADDFWLLGSKIAQRQGWSIGAARRASHANDVEPDARRKRLAVMDASEGLGKFLDYQRSRLRVARATAVNAVLAVPAGAIFLSLRSTPSVELVAFLAFAAMAVFAASVYSAVGIREAWEGSLDSAYDVIEAKRDAESSRNTSSSPKGR